MENQNETKLDAQGNSINPLLSEVKIVQKITASDSVRIDKLLVELKNVVDKNDNYFYAKDPVKKLEDMKAEIDNIFDYIRNFYF